MYISGMDTKYLIWVNLVESSIPRLDTTIRFCPWKIDPTQNPDSNYLVIWCIDKVVAIFAKVNSDTNVEDEEIKDFSIRKGYTVSCYYELLEMFIPYDAPFLIEP